MNTPRRITSQKPPNILSDKLTRSEELYQGLYNGITDALFVHEMAADGMPGQFIEINDEACLRLGYTRQELLDLSPLDIDAIDFGKEIASKAMIEKLLSGETIVFEQAHIAKDRRQIPVEIKARMFTLQGRKVIISLARDITERKKAEEAVRKSEDRYRSLYESTPVMMHSIDPAGRLISVSDHWLKTLGYTKDEVIGRRSTEFLTEQSRKYATEVVLPEYLQTGVCNNIEYQFVRKNGEVLDTLLSAIAERDPAGLFVRSLAVIIDVTERKKIEEMLRRAKENWEESFNTIHDAITIHDEDFNIIQANRAAEELLGLPFMTLNRQKCYESYHGTGCPPEGCPSCQTLTTGKPSYAEFYEPHLRKYLDVKAFPRLNPAGAVVGLVHVIRDVTEQKLAMDALVSAEKKFRDLLETVQLAAVMLDKNGNITFVNNHLLELTGWSIEEVTNKDWFDMFISEDRRASIKAVFRANIETETMLHNEYSVISRDNFQRLIVWDTVVLRAADGSAIGTASIGIDVTEHRKIEEQLRQSQKMEAIGQLAGGVAHDFNNILCAIVGYASLSMSEIPDNISLKTNIEQILAAADRATTLTQSLLAFSRKQVLDPKPVSFNDVVENIDKMLLRLIREDISISTDLAAEEMTIYADSGQIEQIIINLVTNARDAMQKGGNIIIRTESAYIDEEFISAHGFGKAGRYALLTVSDTGVGMSRETIKKIFEPFFTTKEKGKGTGLGLSLVYGIVKQHNGFINVYSEPGKGSTFKIYLPLFSGMESIKETAEEVVAALDGSETILLAEDDEVLRNLMTKILSNHGYAVIQAADGDQAIEKFIENWDRIGLIILDVIMPRKNGKEAYQEIKLIKPSTKAIMGYPLDSAYHYRLCVPSSNPLTCLIIA